VSTGSISAKVTLDGDVVEIVAAAADRRRAELELVPWLTSRGRKDLAGGGLQDVAAAVPEIYMNYILWAAATRMHLSSMPFKEWFDTVEVESVDADGGGGLDPTNPVQPGT